MTETCDPISLDVVSLVPESDCPECEQNTSGCTCTMTDIVWNGAVSDCLASLGITKNTTLQQIVSIFANQICDQATSFDCADVDITSDYDSIGYDGTEHICEYDLSTAIFTDSPEFYITVDGVAISLGDQTSIATVGDAIAALGDFTSSVDGNIITVTGFHDFGNIGYSDITFTPTITDGDTGTLCDLLSALDFKMSRISAVPYGFDPLCFDDADDYFDYITGMAATLCEDLYGDEPIFLPIAGNSITNLIAGDVYFTSGLGLRFYDANFTIVPNIVSYSSATTGGYGLSIFGGLVNNADQDVLPVAFTSPLRQQKYKIYDIAVPVVNTVYTPTTLPYQVFIDKSVITAITLPASTAFPPGVTNVVVRFTATVFAATAAGLCVINPGGVDTIQASASFNFAPSSVSWVELILDGTNWRIAAKG